MVTDRSIRHEDSRFSRTISLVGSERFARLQQSFVTVVGLGAVGGYVVEGLARAGVGSLRLVDCDTLETTNINRQLLALESTLRQQKTAAARERIFDINPECNVRLDPVFATGNNIASLLTPAPDLLIDAIDALNPKVQLLASAWHQGIPTLCSMGAALRTDPSKIHCGDVFDSTGCPLARHIRKRLRRQNVGRGIGCVYSNEEVQFNYNSNEEKHRSTTGSRGRSRHTLGSLPTIPGIFGLLLANEAIMRLTEKSSTWTTSKP